MSIRSGSGLEGLLDQIVTKRAALIAQRDKLDAEILNLSERRDLVRRAQLSLEKQKRFGPDAYAVVRRIAAYDL